MVTKNEIYTRAANAIRGVYENAYITSRREPVPSSFPAAWVVEADTYPDAQYAALDNSDCQRVSVFEVQAFSNLASGAVSQVENMMLAAETEFIAMGYRKTTHTPVDNADTSIYREVARFKRIIGDGDTI